MATEEQSRRSSSSLDLTKDSDRKIGPVYSQHREMEESKPSLGVSQTPLGAPQGHRAWTNDTHSTTDTISAHRKETDSPEERQRKPQEDRTDAKTRTDSKTPSTSSGSTVTNHSSSPKAEIKHETDRPDTREKVDSQYAKSRNSGPRAENTKEKLSRPRSRRYEVFDRDNPKQSATESATTETNSLEGQRETGHNKPDGRSKNGTHQSCIVKVSSAASTFSQGDQTKAGKSAGQGEDKVKTISSETSSKAAKLPPQRDQKHTKTADDKHKKDFGGFSPEAERDINDAENGGKGGQNKAVNRNRKESAELSETSSRGHFRKDRRQHHQKRKPPNSIESHTDQRPSRGDKTQAADRECFTDSTNSQEERDTASSQDKMGRKLTKPAFSDRRTTHQNKGEKSPKTQPEKDKKTNTKTTGKSAAQVPQKAKHTKQTKGKTEVNQSHKPDVLKADNIEGSPQPQAQKDLASGDKQVMDKKGDKRTDTTESQKSDASKAHNKEVSAHPQKPAAQKTKVFIRVRQLFEDVESFADFIKSKITVDGPEFHASESDITVSDGYTYYTMLCPSKTKATKFLQQLNSDKASSKVECRFYQFPSLKRREYEREQMAMRREYEKDQRVNAIGETMFHFDRTSDDLLKNHAQRLQGIQRELKQKKRQRGNFETFDKIRREIVVLEQKEAELSKHREEFIQARDQLKAYLSSSDTKEDFRKELQTLKDRYYRECYRFDRALPVYARRREIVELVQNNQVSVILGETGSGKSTQLVQYLQEAWQDDPGLIVCTQPRRVAALSLATHVAGEMLTRVGQKVGYQVGSKRSRSDDTRIVYTTDHSLLNECLADPDLKAYSCVVVDEAHERSLYTDLLLSMIKRCLPRRPDLRVIVTSATIDPTVFQQFFGGCPVLRVTGRLFPVDVDWRGEDEDDDYLERALKTVLELHTLEPPGDVLVFVTSPAETEKCCQALKQRMGARGDFVCLQLHGKQQAEEQQEVFRPAPRNKRKVVFATNCAETSITIDGIRYVVDTGRAKEMRYDPKRNLTSLCVTVISRSSADQRKGRAGRTAPGKCYRLYSEETYTEMDPVTLPEILRIHLGHALLKLAELGVDRDTYEFVQCPSQDTIDSAIKMLHVLGALEEGRITEKGRWIASLPFDPRLGLLTYLGREAGLLYDCVVLAAVMSAEGGVFYRGASEAEQRVHDVTKTKFSREQGDSLTCLAVYTAWLQVADREKSQWCLDNGLNAKALRGVRETVDEACKALGVRNTTFSSQDVTEQLRKMIFRCYASSLCHYLGRQNAGYYAALAARRVHIHPSSCICALGTVPRWVVYDQLVQTSRDFITGVTPVEEAWLAELDTQVLGFDPQDVGQKTVEKVYSRLVGNKAFFAVVGPSFSKLRELEAGLPTASSCLVFIEASRDDGEISVYCAGDASETEPLTEILESTIDTAVEEAASEDREEVVAGSVKQGIRAVLGPGAQVQEILTCDQSRKLFIRKPPRASAPEEPEELASEETIRAQFSRYGEIKFCKKFDGGKHWGFLIFKRSEDAAYAARDSQYKHGYTGEVERRRLQTDETYFNVQLSWCRRPCLPSKHTT